MSKIRCNGSIHVQRVVYYTHAPFVCYVTES